MYQNRALIYLTALLAPLSYLTILTWKMQHLHWLVSPSKLNKKGQISCTKTVTFPNPTICWNAVSIRKISNFWRILNLSLICYVWKHEVSVAVLVKALNIQQILRKCLDTYVINCYIKRFIINNPWHCFMASWLCQWTFICHIIFSVWY